jgi:hypothetical protein
MKVIQVDGTARQYVFEDGTRVDFGDSGKYAALKGTDRYAVEVKTIEIQHVEESMERVRKRRARI